MSLSREDAGRRASPVEDGGGMLSSMGRVGWGQIACILCIFGALLLIEPEEVMAKSVTVAGFAIAGAVLRLAQVMRDRRASRTVGATRRAGRSDSVWLR